MSYRKYSFIEKALQKRKEQSQFRTLQSLEPRAGHLVQRNERELLNFCSNDYLGLSRHPGVIERARDFTGRYGAGSTASRLISGTFSIHRNLERKLSDLFGGEASLVFNSGFQANSSLIATLTDRHSLVLADRLSHNSILQGALLSRADFKRFDHNDPGHLRSLLEEAGTTYNRTLIVTESVFSMDGDRTDLDTVAGMAEEYGALLMVDDAHAVGVWGRDGLGLARDIEGIDILLGTCGKAFGSFGSFVICSAEMRDYLVNFCPAFIYTTALPPAVIGAIDAASDLIPGMNEERELYHANIEMLRKKFENLGFDTGPSTTQIIPLIIGDEEEALKLAEWLEGEGILVTAIRPPTVPAKSSRLRITLSSSHTGAQINYLIEKLEEWNHA